MRTLILIATLLVAAIQTSAQNYLAAAEKDGLWGFLDENGNWAIEPQYDAVKDFNQKLCLVKKDRAWHYININNEMVDLNKGYEPRYSPSEGRGRVEIDGRWTFVDETGNPITEARFIDAKDFSDGLAPVRCEEGLWGYLDRNGIMAVDCKYRNAKEFITGVALVDTDGGWRYINKNSEILPAEGYDPRYEFSNEMARVRTREGWAYINTTGK